MNNTALQLVQGTKDIRDRYIDRTDVLDRVKALAMLPDGKYIESRVVVDFYEVDDKTVRHMKNRHLEEFISDGTVTLKGDEFKEYRTELAQQGIVLMAKSSISLYTRRAVLRMGMLLTQSPIAARVRNYLLNIEESTTKEQKQRSIWDDESDKLIMNSIETMVNEGYTLGYIFRELEQKIGYAESVIRNRWNNKLRSIASVELKNKIRENLDKFRHSSDKLNDIKIDKPAKITVNETHSIQSSATVDLTPITDNLQAIQSMLVGKINTWEERTTQLEKDNFNLLIERNNLNNELHNNGIIITQLTNEIDTLKESISNRDKIIAERNQRIEHLEKKIKILIRSLRIVEEVEQEEEASKFKMDRNGNLERI